ncbi:uncharacterized protein LOC109199726 [Oreochromis niloticus]|uniref:uncharacterized protein LOC109199726 n=1 Tax=Oreochromis niloticus TaxID=8128 RepID=UPI000905099E|nr:uncharacterized protein LOC109199726 [Oreochromis niloticus]
MSAVTASLCSTLMFVLFVSADQKNITAESGQDVTLTCRAPNNNIISLEWSRADLGDEYVLLYRDGKFVPANQHPSFKNRVDLQDRQMKDGDVSLILKDVTINDAGTYECGVVQTGTEHLNPINTTNLHVVPPGQTGGQEKDEDNKDGGKEDRWTAGLIVGLSVLVAAVVGFLIYRRCKLNPADPHVAERLQHDCQKNITAESGQKNITLLCRAPNNGYPQMTVEWSRLDLGDRYVLLYRDSHFNSHNQHPSFKNRVDLRDRQMKDGDVSLILMNVTINDTGTYECGVVQKEGLKLINSTNLHVDPPGQTGGQEKDEDKEKKEDGSVGLIAGLIVSSVLLVAAVVGFLIYRKYKQQQSEETSQPPVELQQAEMSQSSSNFDSAAAVQSSGCCQCLKSCRNR